MCQKPGRLDKGILLSDISSQAALWKKVVLCVQRELRHLSQSWQHIRKRHHKLQIGTHQQEERKELLVCWRRVTWAGPKEPRVTEEAGSHEPMAETGTFADPPVRVPCEALQARD